MSENRLEKSDMSAVEFAQYAVRERVAPASIGSVKARQRHASRRLGWTPNRVKDVWYADPRIAIGADEIRKIEEATGLRYGQQELRTIEELIIRADALLDGPEADFFRPFVDAIRAMARIVDRSGAKG